MGPDGESAFLDWRNSHFIEGFDLYPLRRATAVLYAAADTSLTRMDIQIQLKADDEWTDRYLWSGDMSLPAGLAESGVRCDAAVESLTGQVSTFLREEAEQGPG